MQQMCGVEDVELQGWRSGESANLPPKGPGLSLLLVRSFAAIGFCPGTPVFPSPHNPTDTAKFQFDQESGTKNYYVDVLLPNRYLFML